MKFIYYKKYCILYSLKRRMYYTVQDGKESFTYTPSKALGFTEQEAQDTINLLDKDNDFIIVDYDATVSEEYKVKNHSFEDCEKALSYCRDKYGENAVTMFKGIPCFQKNNR